MILATTLVTDRLELRRSTPEQLRALIAGPAEFTRQFGLPVAEGYNEFPEALNYALGKMAITGLAASWWSPFLVVYPESPAVIGLCGFKGPAAADGMIELGYGIAPAFRGRGLATEAAAALVNEARRCVRLARVIAHTLPETNASARVLLKLGFFRAANVNDPEDGVIWRWERTP
jgi:ribosomal-protein-alanine N-acetyltransferase